MDKKEFYKTDKPFAVRESFNNTILLLTMVKSEYYYIIDSSRVKGIIEIGFDFESELHGKITETAILDFYGDDNYVELICSLRNIDGENIETIMNGKINKAFSVESGSVVFRAKMPSDSLIPTSIKMMNEYILQAKSEIFVFLEDYYKQCVK